MKDWKNSFSPIHSVLVLNLTGSIHYLNNWWWPPNNMFRLPVVKQLLVYYSIVVNEISPGPFKSSWKNKKDHTARSYLVSYKTNGWDIHYPVKISIWKRIHTFLWMFIYNVIQSAARYIILLYKMPHWNFKRKWVKQGGKLKYLRSYNKYLVWTSVNTSFRFSRLCNLGLFFSGSCRHVTLFLASDFSRRSNCHIFCVRNVKFFWTFLLFNIGQLRDLETSGIVSWWRGVTSHNNGDLNCD
jgi:hypothetical protein